MQIGRLSQRIYSPKTNNQTICTYQQFRIVKRLASTSAKRTKRRNEWNDVQNKNNRELQFRTKWSFFYVSIAELEKKNN